MTQLSVDMALHDPDLENVWWNYPHTRFITGQVSYYMAPPPVATTLERMQAFIANIEFKHFPIPVELRLRPWNTNECVIQIQIKMPDRETGEFVPVQQDALINYDWIDRAPDRICDTLIAKLSALMLHEIQESFHYKGRRVRDPHEFTSRCY